MTLSDMLELLIQGLTLGGLYGLVGAGLALNFGVLKVVNLVHGELITCGGFIAAFCLSMVPNMPFPLILVLAMAGTALVGAGLQALVVERAMTTRDPMVTMLVTFGLGIVARNVMVELFGADLRGLDVGGLSHARLQIGTVSVGVLPLITFAFALAAFATLHVLVNMTAFGRAVRATSHRPDIARLMGVRVRTLHIKVAALAAALAALAGMLLAMRASISPYSGVERLIVAFEVVVLGGVGSIRGALIAGLVLGIAQVVTARFDGNAGLLYVHLTFLAGLGLRAFRGKLS
ncbi:branched-chain amino acid ABC transporter permease [Agrobacterium vitis]|uniref:branched-chain amino acid ABC transporter permease n=1 Tax=Agrobacterium vitis TaxID=373 RepID=UPI0012E81937|nr:branched-chain amino acid ABC transporter permease [Agrobacterium vitis]MVA53440.1 branched-chain amino acid ABC transporter permease [Agrobacterium vitis]NSZ55520.1 branched-chain amino acid ABC transporter permease [Agrobacterium vitis]NTA34771.1 branched-chain amino acid ABC transporter permease [Agrobacterium vitis]